MSDIYILIDNDPLIRKSWEFQAKKSEVELETFATVEAFINDCERFDPSSYVYIDSELDENKLGEEEAEIIFQKGFHNIYLATGKNFEEISLPSYIKGISSKRPPF